MHLCTDLRLVHWIFPVNNNTILFWKENERTTGIRNYKFYTHLFLILLRALCLNIRVQNSKIYFSITFQTK